MVAVRNEEWRGESFGAFSQSALAGLDPFDRNLRHDKSMIFDFDSFGKIIVNMVFNLGGFTDKEVCLVKNKRK